MASADNHDLFLGLDVGTQGTKALLLHGETGKVLSIAKAKYGLIEGLPDGAAEQHPDTWIHAIREVSREILGSDSSLRNRVRCIGVSGQQHGFVALDAEGTVIRPAKLWCDTSTESEAAELSRLAERSIPCGFTASKILHMKTHEIENFKRLKSVLLPHDYINFRLTGEMFMEAGDASGTGFFDPATRAFDASVMAAIDSDLHGMLPRMVDPLTVAGELSKEGAEILGLPKGISVATGSGDNMMSAVGSGATEEGVLVLSLGTSGTAFAYSASPLIDSEGLVAPFCDATGGHLPLICVMNMTEVLHEVGGLLCGLSLDELTAMASKVSPGSEGLLLLPYLCGERTPNLPKARGSLHGIRPGNLHAGAVFRAALEGIALSLGLGVDRMRQLGLPVTEVRCVGGGANNPLLREILASVIDAPLRQLQETESAALGAALHAAMTVRSDGGWRDELLRNAVRLSGEVDKPIPEMVATYAGLKHQLHRTTDQLWN